MKKIYDREMIHQYMKDYEFKDIFENIEDVYLMMYEKGEYISSPLMQNNIFQVVLLGGVRYLSGKR